MTSFVLDTSFAISWVIESERTAKGLAAFEALTTGKAQALVPALWGDEIANVLLTMERAKKLNAGQIAAWVDVFCHLPIVMDSLPIEQSLREVRQLARTHGLSAYDARYLHLAAREELPLATLDKQLLKAAAKAKVECLA